MIAQSGPARKSAGAVILFLCVLLAGVTVLVFGRVASNPFLSDDWVFLYAAAAATSLRDVAHFLSFETGWFVRPLQWLLTWSAYRLFGLEPADFHLLILGLHVLNGLLLGLLGYQIFVATGRSEKRARYLAILVAALFLLNRRQHEAVLWYSSANEVLAASFRLAGLLVLAWFARSGSRTPLVVSLTLTLLYALALLTKESAVVFPAEVALFLVFFAVTGRENPRRLVRRGLPALAPLAVLCGLWCWQYLLTAPAAQRGGLTFLPASPVEWLLRYAQFVSAHWVGAVSVLHSRPLMALLLAGLTLLVILGIRRRQFVWPCLVAWLVLAVSPYVATYSVLAVRMHWPVLTQMVAGDRYLYYSSAAASLLLVAGFDWLVQFLDRHALGVRWRLRWAAVAGIGLYLLANVAVLVQYGNDWATAGRISQGIIQDVSALAAHPAPGTVLCLLDLPDNYRQKYIFRNGAEQALRLALGRPDLAVRTWISPDTTFGEQSPIDPATCSLTWRYPTHTPASAR